MTDDNKENLVYFESSSMRGLFDAMHEWQGTHRRRLLSTDVHRDGELFCCIALTNPSEVLIVCGNNLDQAYVSGGCLSVTHSD
jgi:hypothetical protein